MSIVTTFFSSPFSDQSTSLQVGTGSYRDVSKAQDKWDPRAESRFYPLALWFCVFTASEGSSQLSVRFRGKTRESFLEMKSRGIFTLFAPPDMMAERKQEKEENKCN